MSRAPQLQPSHGEQPVARQHVPVLEGCVCPNLPAPAKGSGPRGLSGA